METTKFRHEFKHYINMSDYYTLRNRFRSVMKPDCNGDMNNEYHIRSLYFDNLYDSALYEKISGVNNREKFRIRYYNNDTTFIRLEKKQKCNNLTAKFSAGLNAEQCNRIIKGDVEWMKESGVPLLEEFYLKSVSGLLKPKTIIDYIREAYIYPAGNVRITFDKSVRTGLLSTNLFDRELPTIESLDKAFIILEVKYDEFLPDVISDILQTNERRQASISKYALGRSFY